MLKLVASFFRNADMILFIFIMLKYLSSFFVVFMDFYFTFAYTYFHIFIYFSNF